MKVAFWFFVLTVSAHAVEKAPHRFDYNEFLKSTAYKENVKALAKFDSSNSAGRTVEWMKRLPFLASSSGKHGTINVHEQITRTALTKKLNDVCIARLVIANNHQDEGNAFSDARNHFDNGEICKSTSLISERKKKILDRSESREARISTFGAILHAIQDFYSHSNYVELMAGAVKVALSTEIPIIDFSSICDGESPRNLSDRNPLLRDLFTASFHGQDHGRKTGGDWLAKELSDSKSHFYWNKDLPPVADYYLALLASQSSFKIPANFSQNLFDIAFDLQVRHSEAYFNELKDQLSQDCG